MSTLPLIKTASQLTFTVHATPVPQGSMQAFTIPDKAGISDIVRKILAHSYSYEQMYKMIFEMVRRCRPILKSDNPELKEFRQKVAAAAKNEMWILDLDDSKPMAGKHVPVEMVCTFYFERPVSCKKRLYPAVKPDIDKLLRAVFDSLTGVAYEDDGQVVSLVSRKEYGTPERLEVGLTILKERELF